MRRICALFNLSFCGGPCVALCGALLHCCDVFIIGLPRPGSAPNWPPVELGGKPPAHGTTDTAHHTAHCTLHTCVCACCCNVMQSSFQQWCLHSDLCYVHCVGLRLSSECNLHVASPLEIEAGRVQCTMCCELNSNVSILHQIETVRCPT